jgi:hypothetical protein
MREYSIAECQLEIPPMLLYTRANGLSESRGKSPSPRRKPEIGRLRQINRGPIYPHTHCSGSKPRRMAGPAENILVSTGATPAEWNALLEGIG